MTKKCMVFTRSQAKFMVNHAEEPQVMTGNSSRDAKIVFMDRVLDKMEEYASRVVALEAEKC